MANECLCNAASCLIFPCSGAADVGAIADQAARRLTGEGVGRMYCLAGIGGRVSSIMKTTKAASVILAISGCELDCAKRCLENAGFSGFKHFRVTDLGLKKGASPPTDERVKQVMEAARKFLLDAKT